MKRLWIALVLLVCFATALPAQSWRGGAIRDPALTQLAKDWERLSYGQPSMPVERAYCVTHAREITAKEDRRASFFIVDSIAPPVLLNGASPYAILQVECPRGTVALIHSHSVGECNPSRADYRTLVRSRDKFAVVQCGSVHHRFYYPHEYQQRRRMHPVLFIGLLGGAIAANTAFRLDRDPGGYRDRWITRDKPIHFAAAGILTGLAQDAGVRPALAFAGVCAAGAAFEWTQSLGGGYASGKDIVMNCSGAALVWAWRRAWR